jgi:hypothetical protein
MRIQMNKQEVELLSQELELLLKERGQLLRVVGAAVVLISNTAANSLPHDALNASEVLSELINALPEETLKDALDSVHAHSETHKDNN